MGHMLKVKCVDSRVNVNILASTSVPFTLTTVQVPNLAPTHTRRITVWFLLWEQRSDFLLEEQRRGFYFRNKGEVILEQISGRSNISQKQAFRYLYFGLRGL
jgi:hypothetical protein